MKFILQIIVSTLAVFVSSYLLPGVHVDSMLIAIEVAAVLAFLNAVLKPLMIVLTIPITIFSFGLFLIVINAFIIIITDKLVDGFEIRSFGWAVVFSIVLWIVTIAFETLAYKKENTTSNS